MFTFSILDFFCRFCSKKLAIWCYLIKHPAVYLQRLEAIGFSCYFCKKSLSATTSSTISMPVWSSENHPLFARKSFNNFKQKIICYYPIFCSFHEKIFLTYFFYKGMIIKYFLESWEVFFWRSFSIYWFLAFNYSIIALLRRGWIFSISVSVYMNLNVDNFQKY